MSMTEKQDHLTQKNDNDNTSQFGLVQSLHLSTTLGAEKGVVLIQVGSDELWEISLEYHLQEHVCGSVKSLFSPEQDRMNLFVLTCVLRYRKRLTASHE